MHLGDARHADAADADEVDQCRYRAATPSCSDSRRRKDKAGQFADQIGEARRRVRPAARRGRPRPCRPDAAALSNRSARWPARVAAVKLGVRDHDAGAGRLEGARVGGLVIVGRIGIRHQDRRPADRRQARPRSRRRRGRSRDARRPGVAAGRRRTSPARPGCRPAHSAGAPGRYPRAGIAGPAVGAAAETPAGTGWPRARPG